MAFSFLICDVVYVVFELPLSDTILKLLSQALEWLFFFIFRITATSELVETPQERGSHNLYLGWCTLWNSPLFITTLFNHNCQLAWISAACYAQLNGVSRSRQIDHWEVKQEPGLVYSVPKSHFCSHRDGISEVELVLQFLLLWSILDFLSLCLSKPFPPIARSACIKSNRPLRNNSAGVWHVALCGAVLCLNKSWAARTHFAFFSLIYDVR